MSIFHKYSIRKILYFVLIIFIAGFLTLSFLAGWQVRKIMMNGPIYNQITQGKDIIADVLPPPLYIIESYLNVLELAAETDPNHIDELLKNGRELKSEFDDRHAHWLKELKDGELGKTLLEESFAPAVEFYRIRDTEFIPALKKGISASEKKIILGKMKAAYNLHRKKIDNVVVLATKRNTEDEIYAHKSITRALFIIGALVLIFFTSFTYLYLWVTQSEEAKRAMTEQVHELQEAKDLLVSRTAQLEFSNKELESFSYSVSHDLRSPLRGIDGWSLALMEDYGHLLDERARGYLERVRAETQRMGDLIDDLLKLSQFSRTEMKWEKVNLSKIARTVVERLQEENPGRSIQFVIEPSLHAQGDSHFLEIVLTNLLNNACKFTGKIKEAKIEFGKTFIQGREVYFIRDNGAGFNMSSAKKLFETFQRMHKQSEFPGTGVGLATVKRIVALHQGKIWAEASLNRGATFYFTLNEKA